MPRLNTLESLMLIVFLCMILVACDNLSRDNYDKLKVGMSRQDFEKLLGSGICDSAVGMRSCTWGTAEKHIKVQFVADKIAVYSSKGLK